jgi:signal transduction histidine kinase
MLERLGRYDEAFALARQCLRRLEQLDNVSLRPRVQVVLARAHLHTGRPDSAYFYGQATLQATQRSGDKQVSRDASEVVAQASAQRGRFADAYRYYQLFTAYKDSLSSQDLIRRMAGLQYQFTLDQQQTQIRLLNRTAQLSRTRARQQRLLLGGSLMALVLVGGLSGLLWRNNRLTQRANALLAQQKAEVQAQRDQTTQALTELKATQAQLVQREKLASLGELTAGIAHELQNPLNFVTNFSDLGVELCQEAQALLASAGGLRAADPAVLAALLHDLEANQTKIAQHGQRASSIVRGMLEHARPSTGERQAADLNALCEEYLRLAYQTVRAKDPSFTATLTLDLAPNLGEVAVVSQDIGRVLLNLYTNAFYALQQRARQATGDYRPEVTVRSRRMDGHVQVQVCDNGLGMSEGVQQKVFQPFFTTKPPGEGTGLGLSLSYDIITKGHGGTLTVESQAGKYTEFILCLPADSNGRRTR